MGPTRIVILLVAAVAAIGLAVVARSFFNRPAVAPAAAVAPPVAAGKPVAQVLTAKHDLAIGERLTADDLTWTAWPVEALNPAFVTDGAAPAAAEEKSGGKKLAKAASDAASAVIGGATPMKQFEGAIVREPMLTGEPVIDRKVVRGGEGGYLSVVLASGHRAVSIPITVETGAGGFILPGDRVDVLQSREVNSPAAAMTQAVAKTTFVADTVLSNIRVLAVDQNIEAPKAAKSLVGATATLEVTPADAELLMRAKAQGTLQLSLRPYTDAGAPSGALHRDAPSSAASNIVRIHRGGPVSSEPVTP
jgi:pilus assembly protein CpaB